MKKGLAWILALLLLLGAAVGCAAPAPAPEKTEVRLGLLKGPTGIGGAYLLERNAVGEANNAYTHSLFASPTDITAKIISQELDLAAVPSNLAATLYAKTNGDVKVVAVNTLGTLYLLENGDTVHSPEDLRGRTVLLSGQGATPEYALDYILDAYGLKNEVKVEFVAEHAEAAAKMTAGEADLVLLPEPNVTTVLKKAPGARIALDLDELWTAAAEKKGEAGRKLIMGCVVARTSFVEEHKAALDAFLKEYRESIEYANAHPAETGVLCEKYEIVPSAAVAEAAIPNCHIAFLEGAEMKTELSAFLGVLYGYKAQIVGGKLPDDAFYYAK